MFTCDICNYKSQWKHNITQHLKTKKHADNVRKHEEAKLQAREERKHFICAKCGKRFINNQKLNNHVNRKKPCVEEAIVVQPTTIINNNTLNQTVNYYAQALEENLYRNTTYAHIPTESLDKAMREYNDADRYNSEENRIVGRYKALAMIISNVHWDIQHPCNRNMLVLSMFPTNKYKTGAEYFVLDVDENNDISWSSADIPKFKNMMLDMLDAIQKEKDYDLSKMISFFRETINEQYIGSINKVIWSKYWSYTGERENIDKTYHRPDINPKKKTSVDNIYKQLVKHETLVSNSSFPIPVKSTFLSLKN